MRRALILSTILGCSSASTTTPPATSSTATPTAAVAAPSAPGHPVVVPDADRACTADADCTAVLTQCSMCAGACTGVRVDRAASYDGTLDCAGYHGAVCNYDCRPSFHIEQPRCVGGRCESVRIEP